MHFQHEQRTGAIRPAGLRLPGSLVTARYTYTVTLLPNGDEQANSGTVVAAIILPVPRNTFKPADRVERI